MKDFIYRLFLVHRRFAAALAVAVPLCLLLLRLWVAVDFWRAGVVKVADLDSTLNLFENVYQVPLLSPDFAAYLATFIELVFPWLLGLGLLGRLSAVFLFFYNIIAVISYPDLWPHGLWAGFWGSAFNDHKVWALMLLNIACFGPGALSLDRLIERWILPRLGHKAHAVQ